MLSGGNESACMYTVYNIYIYVCVCVCVCVRVNPHFYPPNGISSDVLWSTIAAAPHNEESGRPRVVEFNSSIQALL